MYQEFIKIFPAKLRELLKKAELDYGKLQEIRLRADKPLLLWSQGKEYFLKENGCCTKAVAGTYVVTRREIQETLELVAGYSLYAFEEELKQGFLTIPGGHRIGITGKVIADGDRIKNLQYISALNVRLSHEIRGCADGILPYLRKDGELCHTLIISPPKCGKTTLLRDLIRQISDGSPEFPGKNVGVVDERSELGGCYLGVPENDLGIRTDILDCCPKAEGMLMLLRSMSPEVIAVDEIGAAEDVHAIEYVIHCGCKLLATVHGASMEEIRRKPLLQKLLKEGIFERYLVLEQGGQIGSRKRVFDEKESCIYREGAGC